MSVSSPEGLIPSNREALIGIMGNVPHQPPRAVSRRTFDGNLSYDLGIVEFDDQGVCHYRTQMAAIADKLAEFGEQDAIIIVFVHGWKHDARSDDDNLAHFSGVLEAAVRREAEVAAESQRTARPVFGVFVGWRGMTLYSRRFLVDTLSLSQLTFWDRQEAGRRVSTGSIRELLGRLRQYRNRQAKDGSRLLVIVGHSFGGMIVYSAVAQSLIEAAATPQGQVTPSFADLVLLVNPAVEAARYLPVHQLVYERSITPPQGLAEAQAPVFVCVTARNDWATGLAFPFGNAFSLLTEKCKDRRERQALLNTIGHISWMKTHDLSASGAAPVLTPPRDAAGISPFWVVQATPDVINGHNDIFRPVFLEFLARLLGLHVQESALRATRAP
ncbi:hypothetical protein RZS28_04800 [Methylocapsa polymorpha]|uniref:Uncharacterized protein n=1 Tax=Methylocapsa polymorpha TaxID=3080828 RepID=A0ABZ0HWA2_9HYPH|nr:hypothetical protein RZS28_04800 [Methylocapsa sp. RX1]